MAEPHRSRWLQASLATLKGLGWTLLGGLGFLLALVLIALSLRPDMTQPPPQYSAQRLAEVQAQRDTSFDAAKPEALPRVQREVNYAEGKRGAWMADDGLKAWTDFLLKAVKEGGRIVVVHRADRLADLLALLGEKAGSFAVRPIHPFADEPAKRVLVHAIKTGHAPLRLLPPLILHDREGGKHTPQAEAIMRGEASLGW